MVLQWTYQNLKWNQNGQNQWGMKGHPRQEREQFHIARNSSRVLGGKMLIRAKSLSHSESQRMGCLRMPTLSGLQPDGHRPRMHCTRPTLTFRLTPDLMPSP